MKIFFSIMLLFAFIQKDLAQIVLQPGVPPEGLMLRSQLWNMTIVNAQSAPIQVRIEVSMMDVASGNIVLAVQSRLITLSSGAQALQMNDFMPLQFLNINGAVGFDPNPNAFLPIGQFNLCYNVFKIESDAPEHIAEECVDATVEPISPPQLVEPFDEDLLSTNRPLFIWLPPSPAAGTDVLSYDVKLVSVNKQQSPVEAIKENLPLLALQNINYTSFQYGPNQPELDTNSVYAWYVGARYNGNLSSSSEIWTFRVKPDSIAAVQPGSRKIYAAVSREQNGSYSLVYDNLHFQYLNESFEDSLEIRVFELSGNSRAEVKLDKNYVAIHRGINYIDYSIADGSFAKGQFYMLELTNRKHETWFLKFLLADGQKKNK